LEILSAKIKSKIKEIAKKDPTVKFMIYSKMILMKTIIPIITKIKTVCEIIVSFENFIIKLSFIIHILFIHVLI